MLLYLVQHGEAVHESIDPTRPLSEAGRRDVHRVAEFLRPHALTVAEIRHSGKLRARQTAEILATAFTPLPPLREHDHLRPSDDPEPVVKAVQQEVANLCIVGHLPNLARFASLLLVGQDAHPCVQFERGAVLCLERDDNTKRWCVRWFIPPHLLAPDAAQPLR